MTLRQAAHRLPVATRGQGLVEITDEIAGWLDRQAPETGLLTIFCRHTSASLVIQENADPSVQRDLPPVRRPPVLEQVDALPGSQRHPASRHRN